MERLVDNPVLKTGTVREMFNLTGNTPVSKERFMTWDKGVEIKSATFFSTLVFKSSISRLVLVSKDKIISLTIEWLQRIKSKLTLDAWINESGQVFVTGILVRISFAISEKNKLKEFAIKEGSDIHSLLILTSFI